MRKITWLFVIVTLVGVAASQAQQGTTVAKDATVNGLKLHYLEAGKGPETVILLHGFTQTSRMWRPLIPRLAPRFRVIAPDLPNIGGSWVLPTAGEDITKSSGSSQSASFGASAATGATISMKMAAVIIHDLARKLGVTKARVVGHDIGLMVAYAYAAQFPNEVEKLVLMDAFLPGIGDWEETYNDPRIWHFRFQGPTPDALVRGRERTYFEHFWNDFAADKTHSLPEADRAAYTAAYARPGRMGASWEYFKSFPDDAKDFQKFAQTKLTMPVLSVGGEMSRGDRLGGEVQQVGTNVQVIILKGSGHWVMEEKPRETMDALEKFLQ
jgi:pimeloyl-ACP methyl ester carboxylesterase